MIAFTCYNLVTNKRHYLGSIAKKFLCRCGCRGWDTMYPIMRALEWSFEASAQGARPTLLPDASEFPDGSPSADLVGSPLDARFVLVQVKGDWSEWANALGFANWQSYHRPCLFCACKHHQLFDFNRISLAGHDWPTLEDDDYENTCLACEKRLRVDSEISRQSVILIGGLHFDDRKQKCGRILARDVPILGLCRHDRLDPSPDLPDTEMFEDRAAPFTAIFWRRRLDHRRRNLDSALRRNPIFSRGVGITPQTSLHIDTLHILYLGVFQRYCSEVIWNVLECNMYDATGGQDVVQEKNISQLFVDYRVWCQRENVDLSYRIGTLTRKMLGQQHLRDLKTKAAETGVLVRWATDFCARNTAKFEGARILEEAGRALLSYMDIIRTRGRTIPWSDCQVLLDMCLRHMALMDEVPSPKAPKSHMFAHLTLRIPHWGNPRFYSTFLDESLNLTLAVVAAASHRLTWERSIFDRMRLLPHLERNGAWAAV